MKVIDLTHTISEAMPVYPGTEKPKLTTVNTYSKDGFKETLIQIYSHVGTHMDPPAHIFANQKTLDQFSPEQFIGKALVIDCRDLKEGQSITIDKINMNKAASADFLLFFLFSRMCLHSGFRNRIGNCRKMLIGKILFCLWDKRWKDESYFNDYPCIDDEVLEFILQGNFKGIGFDVIGLDPIHDENLTRHKALFKNRNIVNIENLKNLDQCGKDLFWFSCFPLKIENCDGSPIRAVAWYD